MPLKTLFHIGDTFGVRTCIAIPMITAVIISPSIERAFITTNFAPLKTVIGLNIATACAYCHSSHASNVEMTA